MTITVNMSKQEFLEYNEYANFKYRVKCGIIDLKEDYNELLKLLLDDGIWKDNNSYGKVVNKINKDIDKLEEGEN